MSALCNSGRRVARAMGVKNDAFRRSDHRRLRSMAAAKPALPAISRSKTAASSALAGISAAKPRKPSTPQTSPSRPASSTSKPTPTSRYRAIQRREQGAPGRDHRDHRPLRLLGRAGAAREVCDAQELSQPQRALENERGRSAAAGRIRFGWLEPATTRRIEALVLHAICASQHEFERNSVPPNPLISC